MTGAIGYLFDGANWSGSQGLLVRLLQHLALTVATVAIACAIALPIALWLGHIGKGGALAINTSNVGRAVPTFAALVLLAFTFLGFGTKSTLVALILFAIPPVLTNAYVGMRGVDRATVEAATGMGMTGGQLLRKVELPLAWPLILVGLELCTVQVIATATIAALVAGPGLGRVITAGYGEQNQNKVVAGAIVVTALALLAEVGFVVLRRFSAPAQPSAGSNRRTPRAAVAKS